MYKILLQSFKTIIVTSFTVLFCSSISAQDMIPIEITVGKITHLFFNSNVKYCDVGITDIDHKENGNVVVLATKKANFEETNLTVITADNHCYTFLLMYSAAPRSLNITPEPKFAKIIKADFAPVNQSQTVVAPAPVIVTPTPVPAPATTPVATGKPVETKVANANKEDEPKVATSNNEVVAKTTPASPKPVPYARVIEKPKPVEKPKPIKRLNRDSIFLSTCKRLDAKDAKYTDLSVIRKNMALVISNIVEDDSCLYISFAVQNHSSIDYNVSFVNFQTIEKNGVFASANREDVKKPVYILNKKDIYTAKKTENMVYVFKKFTIGKGRLLHLEIAERNDQRLLVLDIPSSAVNNAEKFK